MKQKFRNAVGSVSKHLNYRIKEEEEEKKNKFRFDVQNTVTHRNILPF